MWNRKKKRIEALEADKTALQARLDKAEGDPWYRIAQDLAKEVGNIAASGVNIDPKVTAAIAKKREELYQARITKLAQAQIAQETDARKAAIEQAALTRANALAALALQHFEEHEADDYRQAMQEQLNHERPDIVLREARSQIEQEERQRRVDAAKERMLAARTPEALRSQFKQRAQEIRSITKQRRYLRFEDLLDNDPLVLGFASPGRGNEQLTGYGYSTFTEARKLTGRLIDRNSGMFEVEKDSWQTDRFKTEEALLSGTYIKLGTDDPLTPQSEQLPRIVKAAPLTLRSMEGEVLPGSDLEIWWVNLANFRILS